MKLNKFRCPSCWHEFYDSEKASRCDACGGIVELKSVKVNIDHNDVRLVESTTDGHIREVVSRSIDDARTSSKAK